MPLKYGMYDYSSCTGTGRHRATLLDDIANYHEPPNLTVSFLNSSYSRKSELLPRNFKLTNLRLDTVYILPITANKVKEIHYPDKN